MPLEQSIEATTTLLRQGRLPNEQAVSQSVVLRLLSDLGWDVYDPAVVWPEYATGEGRVDFALCHPPTRPKVFIEVKQMGRAADGVRQALEYAFHTGVPLIVLTDGRTWSFYLPAEQGSYEDRRVYMLDLYERSGQEAADTFREYLDRARVSSDAAIEHARTEYRRRNRRAQARSALVQAWRDLVNQGDETLVELVSAAVESRVGIRPDGDDVADYLKGLGTLGIPAQAEASPTGPNPPRESTTRPRPPAAAAGAPPRPAPLNVSPPPAVPTGQRAGTLLIRGQSFPYQNAKDAMNLVLRTLAEADPGFMERLARHPRLAGRTRRYVATSTELLYPDREDLRDLHEQLTGGWLVSTNLNNNLKGTIIRAACEVAGLAFGRDVVVDF